MHADAKKYNAYKKSDIQEGQAPRTKEKHEKLMENCILSTMLTNLSM